MSVLIGLLAWLPLSCAVLQDRVEPPGAVAGGTRFQLDSASARTVYVAGEFNGWESRPEQPRAVPLKKTERGLWEATVPIPPGRYQYKFVIDNSIWIVDPNNPLTVDDGRGNVNSLVIVR